MKADTSAIENALKVGEKGWKEGDNPIEVLTFSGSHYTVWSDGKIDGKMKGGSFPVEGAELGGAVYRTGIGPIRVKQIVKGLMMEFYYKGERYTSSTVIEIKPLSLVGAMVGAGDAVH